MSLAFCVFVFYFFIFCFCLLVVGDASYCGMAIDWYGDSEWRYLANSWMIATGIHRVFSAIELYIDNRGMNRNSKNCKTGMIIICLQLLDLEIFRDVYATILSNQRHPHEKDRMYWIRAMEAVFVSFGLTVLLFIYLFDNPPTNPQNFFALVTLFVALISSSFALVHYTQSETVTFGHFSKRTKGIVEAIEIFFRLCEVLGRSLLFALIWFVTYI